MLANSLAWRTTTYYWIFLKRWMSMAQNNITYHMGLDTSRCHAAQTAIILNDTDRLSYRDLSKQVGSMVALLHTTFGLNVYRLFLFKLS